MKHTDCIEVDGFKLSCITEGEGPDVLVIGSALYYQRSFSQNLRKFLRLHFVDYRGFAEGPKGELTFNALLEDIEHVRKRLDLKKFVIVGHSAHGLLYPSELKIWSPGRVKAPGIVDRKSVNISNINRFTIGDSRELSRVLATKF